MELPEISIVVSLFNKELYIQETVQSIRLQDFINWELIIIDDCSTDNSVSALQLCLEEDNRIRFLQNETNKGANFCRNLGIQVAIAPYILLLDADDLLSKTCLSQRLAVMKENDQLDFCVFSMGIFRKLPGDLNGDWIPHSKNPLAGFLSHRLPWALPQPIWKTRFLRQIGGFDESFLRLQDVELHTKSLFTENVRFSQMGGKPDCFYRIDNERKNFESYELLSRYVQSAILYYKKFSPLAEKKNIQNKLMGTIYRIYTRILYSRRTYEIDDFQLKLLEKNLLDSRTIINLRGFRNIFFKIGKFAARLPIRIPGINRLISSILEI